MMEIISGGLVLIGLAYAENRGWLDKEKASFVVNVGMQAGICAGLLYFISRLSEMFL
ncbi:hypothetical protein ABEV41_01755 [Geobacillus thermodenitrificans]|jgi:hypothetical protein|uniref:hypothetical protein n=1 Tax=Geobacillus thermodenitrificans TaxID=33940 RepID=UPI002E1BAB8C|nr:hypothetical protein [Geobacillus thermodenitrificans]